MRASYTADARKGLRLSEICKFMVYVSNNIPKKYQAYCRELYFGREINVVRSGNDKQPHYKKLKDMGVKNYSIIFTQEENDE